MAKRKSEAVWYDNQKRWQINVQENGVRKTFTSSLPGRRGKADAERKAEKWLEDHTTAENARVESLLQQYVDYLRETKSTGHAAQYEGFVRLYITPVIGRIRMNRLTEGDLQAVLDLASSKNRLAEKTLRDVRGCMKNWLKWCRQRGKTRLYPESLVIPAGAKRAERKIVQPDGLKVLFSSDKTTWHGKETEDFYIHMYRFAVLTGLRPGELRELPAKAISKTGKITVRRAINVRDEITQGKNENACRTMQLSPMAVAEVDAQKKMLEENGVVSTYLFPSADGSQMKHKNFYRYWQRYCVANGIEKTSLYELRHTFVSVNKEMPEGLKKMVIGHSEDMDTEGTYGHKMAGDLEKAASYTQKAFAEIINKK